MTGEQLTLGDCDPTWPVDTTTALVLLHGHIRPEDFDLRHQGLTAWQIHTMTTVDVKGDVL
ncbi:hypothetical protein [Streptomyces sp. 1222.5]|uniref:hypothetical protein n=1 Tax=Streptomyces sp. 1222.5 TaxID=1881026 RepID=UPI003EBD8B6F